MMPFSPNYFSVPKLRPLSDEGFPSLSLTIHKIPALCHWATVALLQIPGHILKASSAACINHASSTARVFIDPTVTHNHNHHLVLTS